MMVINLVTLALLSLAAAKCAVPTGIADPSLFAALPPNSPSPADSVIFKHIALAIPEVKKLEAPIQFYHINNALAAIFNTMGAFEDLALDIWGNEQPIRFCKDSPNFALYRSVALAHITSMVHKDIYPLISADFDTLVLPWGIDPKRCFDRTKPNACTDISTPWGLAFYRYKQYLDWSSRDGWNRDGSLSRDFNRVPFQDWTRNPYIPKNSPWRVTNKRKWQPLLEDNGLGFMFYQEHVVAHIGQYGRSFFVDDKTFCSLTAPNPRYNYAKELDDLIVRSAAMAENDVTKAKTQVFDDKFLSLNLLQNELLLRKDIQADKWEYIESDMVSAAALYEAALLVWKEKINHDAIRPNTRMKIDRSGRKITAYAGPNQGKKTMSAEDWEPYIRTMPHSEYPSGSACFCMAFANAVKLLFGSDEFIAKGKSSPLSLTVAAGQSLAEPGLPQRNITLTYTKWSDVARDCLQSRLDGGMHFAAAVPEGASLCAPLGKLAFDAVKALSRGERPAFVQDFKKPLQRKGRCRKHEVKRV